MVRIIMKNKKIEWGRLKREKYPSDNHDKRRYVQTSFFYLRTLTAPLRHETGKQFPADTAGESYSLS
jgi:hypothetical protein